MISKKALLIAMGLAFAVPSTSHALTRAELMQQMMDQMAALEAEENKELEAAKEKTAEVVKKAASTEEKLNKNIASVNKLLEDTRLAKKVELTEAINQLSNSVKSAYNANQERLASERKLNKMITDKHNKRVTLVSKAIDALTNIVKA